MTFGEKLLNLRKSRNLSQEQLAEKLCVTRQAVSRWELNETLPESENIVKLADMFYVSTEYLLNDSIDTYSAGRYIPVYADKYDAANLLASVASVIVSVLAFCYYGVRAFLNYSTYSKLVPQRTGGLAVYYDIKYYEIIDEAVILSFLTVVIIISVITALKCCKKCNFKNKLNKNGK